MHRLILLCIDQSSFEFNDHFIQGLDRRGLFFADVLLMVQSPGTIRLDGDDEFGRQRVLLRGEVVGGEAELLVCVEPEPFCEFITIYWI